MLIYSLTSISSWLHEFGSLAFLLHTSNFWYLSVWYSRALYNDKYLLCILVLETFRQFIYKSVFQQFSFTNPVTKILFWKEKLFFQKFKTFLIWTEILYTARLQKFLFILNLYAAFLLDGLAKRRYHGTNPRKWYPSDGVRIRT